MDKRIAEILNIPSEDRNTEFKRLGNDIKIVTKITETIAAMANTDGGRIILGIDDPEKTKLKDELRIAGIEENMNLFDEIGRNITRIKPALPRIWPPELINFCENKTIAIISVPKSKDDFKEIDGKVFERLEKGNKEVKAHDLVKFAYAKGFTRADEELVDVNFRLLDTEYYSMWKKARNLTDINIEENLFKTGLARTNTSGILQPTKASVLLFAEYPSDITTINSEIRVLEYTGKKEKIEGSTINLRSTPKTFKGPIYKLIKDVQEYVLNLLSVKLDIKDSGFENQYALPERSVKEAITNAVIHRDYYLNRHIEIKIYTDRLEVINPGLFTSNITIFNIGKVRAENYRNRLVVKHLLEFPMPPNLDQNEGVNSMFNEMKEKKLYPPVYYTYPELENSIKLVLYFENADKKWNELTKAFTGNKYLNNQIARKAVKVENYEMSRLFKKWTSMGFLIKIEKSGEKSFRYKLKNQI